MEARHESPPGSTPSAAIAAGDQPEAALTIGPSARLPIPVMVLWLCAFAGLVVYTASWYVPSLAQLGK